ncbi:hypothetical protein JCM10449v2_003294 [Rhodotorula kratochvilovae]
MAPTPTEDARRPAVHSHLPTLHLRCLDLADEGSEVFFAHTSSPHAVLSHAASNVLQLLYPTKDSHPPPVRSITLHLRSFDGVAYTCGSHLDNEHKEVHLSLSYLAGVAARAGSDGKRVRQEIEGVLTHELVHAFQYDGGGTVPGGVIEGVADWLRGEAGLAPPHWREQPGDGDRWDQGYERTGFFLSYLSRHLDNPHLVPQLNSALRNSSWEEGAHLRKLLGGEDVENLWETYRRSFEKADKGDAPAPIPTHGPRSGYGVQY